MTCGSLQSPTFPYNGGWWTNKKYKKENMIQQRLKYYHFGISNIGFCLNSLSAIPSMNFSRFETPVIFDGHKCLTVKFKLQLHFSFEESLCQCYALEQLEQIARVRKVNRLSIIIIFNFLRAIVWTRSCHKQFVLSSCIRFLTVLQNHLF